MKVSPVTRSRAKPDALPASISFRAFLEDSAFCGLDLSPAVAAIADASEGIPVDLADPECLAIFGCMPAGLPTVRRRTVCVSAGGRGGKSSRMLAPKALHAAWTVPLPDMRANEKARAVLIAPDKDLAEQDLDYVRGYAEDSPVLRKALVAGTGKTRVRLRRTDGREVDIVVGAATRGGKSVRARCLVFVGMDETAFFYSENGYEVTDKEIARAAIQRIVPGGQLWMVTTPWIEGVGVLESRLADETAADGTRRHERALVVARVSTHMLNPKWDREPGHEGEIEADMRATDPENAAREIDAIPLAAGTVTFFDPVAVSRAFDIAPWEGKEVGGGAGADLGLSGDPSTLALVDRWSNEKFTAYGWREHRPVRGQPLKLSEVCGSFAEGLKAEGFDSVGMDSHAREPAREYMDLAKIRIVSVDGNVKTPSYLAARKVLHDGRLRIVPGEGVSRERLRAQLLSIVSKPLQGGGIQISAPRRRDAGAIGYGHGDLVSALVIALWISGAGKVARTAEARTGFSCGHSRWENVRGMRVRQERRGGASADG